jgi:hypothetical protein
MDCEEKLQRVRLAGMAFIGAKDIQDVKKQREVLNMLPQDKNSVILANFFNALIATE